MAKPGIEPRQLHARGHVASAWHSCDGDMCSTTKGLYGQMSLRRVAALSFGVMTR